MGSHSVAWRRVASRGVPPSTRHRTRTAGCECSAARRHQRRGYVMGATVGLRKASPALVMAGRAGYAAKGVVYIVIGALAAKAAAGSGGRATDSKGALVEIGDGPFGTLALVLIGVGLLGYMTWRL